MPFFYSSDEEIRKGDRALVHGEAGEVEFIADPAESPDDKGSGHALGVALTPGDLNPHEAK
jgi:hypothetical protein